MTEFKYIKEPDKWNVVHKIEIEKAYQLKRIADILHMMVRKRK